MKGYGLASAALLCLASGPAAADYVEIKLDLSKVDLVKPQDNQGGPQGRSGGRPLAGPSAQDEGKTGPDLLQTVTVILEAKSVRKHRVPQAPAPMGQPNTTPQAPQYMTVLEVDHEWGKVLLFPSELIEAKNLEIPPVVKDFGAMWKKAVKNKSPEDWLALAGWALKHGLVKEFPRIMGELEKVAPKDPAVAAFKKIQAAMKIVPREDDPSARWLLEKRSDYDSHISGARHYKLLTKSADKKVVDSYLKRLEETYQGFFYWFAWKGVALQVPRQRLVVVLVSDQGEFDGHRQIFPAASLGADGFLARRENVAVLSSRPQDPLFDVLDKENQKFWKEGGLASKDALLKGTKDVRTLSQYVANVQALTVVQKLMEEQGEWATVTHEGLLQLLAASGTPFVEGASFMTLLPRNVLGPDWIRFGLASFFETPREAYWHGFTAPNDHYWLRFREAAELKKLENPEAVLESVITDRLFREARAAKDPEKLEFARTMSWSLTYYIAEKKGAEKLIKYFQLLAELPRDMEVDGAVLKSLFIQVFGDLKPFAEDWKTEILKISLDVPNRFDNYKKEKELRRKAEEEKKNPTETPRNPKAAGPTTRPLPKR